jgi:translation initiation factor IF-3
LAGLSGGDSIVRKARRLISSQGYRINERIRIREVRLIDENGNNIGVMPTQKAREYADSKGLDLVEVAPEARPPVCRIMDYGKFMYEQTKKERLAKKTQKQVEIKGIRIRPDTDMYHIGFKVKNARSFLMKGNKVRITCQFRGRERSHPEIARQTMKEIAEMLADIAVIEISPNFEGRNMTMVFAPNTTVIEKLEKQAARERAAAEQAALSGIPAPAPTPADPDQEDEEFDEDDMLDDDDDFDDEDNLEGEDVSPDEEGESPAKVALE